MVPTDETRIPQDFLARAISAVRYAVIDRSDSGHPRLALANVAGALAGGFITSNLADEFHSEIHKTRQKIAPCALGVNCPVVICGLSECLHLL